MTEPMRSFIDKWRASGGAERANYQHFLVELCDVLGVPRPDPSVPDDDHNAYVFEKAVTFLHGDGTTSAGRIDLYKRGAFVLEAKQGTEKAEKPAIVLVPPKATRKGTAVRHTKGWDDAMVRARGQAEQYARALPVAEGWPPFLVVVDVGHTIELYADFSGTGKRYLPFPDARTHRTRLADLAQDTVRARLRAVWLDTLALDPSRVAAAITREVAARLAALARSLEQAGNLPEEVAGFLMRCLFTMFAEDVGLLPAGCFTRLLDDERNQPDVLALLLADLWGTMKTGGFSVLLRAKILRINGALFAQRSVPPLTTEQVELLRQAAKADWKHVEPAIFGVLLERALDPRERHALGAHFTPRGHVERLVFPTVIEPLRDEWAAVQAAAYTLASQGRLDKARDEVRVFHRRLCELRVLDPACGSANFLYVTLEHVKRLEGEVLTTLHDLGESQTLLALEGLTVDPHQFLGLEVNPRAAAIADVVLWIGYLQWHFRTQGQVMPAEPVLRPFQNIECRDAVLDWDSTEAVLDEHGEPVTRWDGVTVKPHPVTGEPVPDDTARVPVVRYVNPRKAAWPEADFIVGNPPYIGNKRLRQALGDGYVEALRAAHPDVAETVDLVMYWWHEAAERVRMGRARRFGFVTTNSLTQTQNRKVVQTHLTAEPPLSLVFAVPDHPWVEGAGGAAVRVAMTVGASGGQGLLLTVAEESANAEGSAEVAFRATGGRINADLTVGADASQVVPLASNRGLAFTGMYPLGQGFVLLPEDVPRATGTDAAWEAVVRPFVIARDLTQKSRHARVIDFYPRTEAEAREQFPCLYQWVLTRVKPERDENPRESRRVNWWRFAEPGPNLRIALEGLRRYIAVPRTAKHFTFQFVGPETIPDTSVVAIATDDAWILGVLSSRVHLVWATHAGGRLGVGNDTRYQHQQTFNPFPFPACADEQKAFIRNLGERLDAHRKRQQAQHPGLTLTKTYNVLAKLRAGAALTPAERQIHEQGLVSVLRQFHDDLDAAVFEAYGWPTTLTNEELLERLVTLNAERAAEEARGLVRWLRRSGGPSAAEPRTGESGRPELPTRGTQTVGWAPPTNPLAAAAPVGDARTTPIRRSPWPQPLPAQAQAVLAALRAAAGPATAEVVARTFKGAPTAQVSALLETLAALGQVRRTNGERYTAS